MIRINGKDWGTAAQIAAALGPDIRPGTVHKWARRDGLPRYRTTDDAGRPQVLYPHEEAAAIEARKRLGGFGRPRQLDIGPPQATSFVHTASLGELCPHTSHGGGHPSSSGVGTCH